VFFPGEECGVHYKIQMPGIQRFGREQKEPLLWHRAEAAAAVPFTRSTFAHYQPQSSASL
jgi:hypothetical protein